MKKSATVAAIVGALFLALVVGPAEDRGGLQMPLPKCPPNCPYPGEDPPDEPPVR